jgi:CheY-like chemotaxis protein/anti-sigma regulatory factor (Ser/Thr protein kinase)
MPLPKSILLVDDDPESQPLLRHALPPGGEWSIEPEANGDRALLRVAAKKYGVVLAALETPGVGGTEFVRRLRRIRPDTKVIVTATVATPEAVIESIKAHAFAHFTKPFDAEALAQMIIQATDTPAWTDGIETLSASPQWIELRVQCKMVTADRLVQFLREMKLDLPPEEREGICTAFREMLVNAMDYGGQFDPEQTVEVSYMRTQCSLIYCIGDPGSGFSLDQLPQAAISNPDDAPSRHLLYRTEHGMRAGGFGILFARKLVDDLVYNERGNKVLLIKYLKDQQD